MKIDDKLVEHIARLARLSLTGDERTAMVSDLSNILDYTEKLDKLDTRDVEPTSHVVGITNVMRDDRPRPSISADEALSNAPDRADNFYRVPKIIE